MEQLRGDEDEEGEGGGLEGGNYGTRSGEERPVLAGEVREERKGKKFKEYPAKTGSWPCCG